MKALVKAKPEAGLSYEDVPVPEIGRGDVLIKVLRTGICGTDLHIYAWDAWAQANVPVPLIVGHEFVGQIVDVKADESVLDAAGKPDILKVLPLVFSPGNQVYYGVGVSLGHAFAVGKEV